MGKGDIKTKRGKITKGTYGVRRMRSRNKKAANQNAEAKTTDKKEALAAKPAASKKEK